MYEIVLFHDFYQKGES